MFFFGKNSINDTLKDYYKSTNVETYKEVFTMRRQQHKDIIKGINLLDGIKQGKFITSVIEEAFKLIYENRIKLLNANYMIKEGQLDENYEVKKSLSNILEYTLLCGDLVLYFPKLTHYAIITVAISDDKKQNKNKYINKDTNNFLLKWAINISNATKLLGPKDTETLWLMSQELGYIPKDPLYINPYAVETDYILEKKLNELNLLNKKSKGSNIKHKEKSDL